MTGNYKKIMFVVNPISGDRSKSQLYSEIESGASKYEVDNFITMTTGKDDKEKIQNHLENESPDKVIVVGGDGTINMVGSLLVDTGIPLGIIPAGSANGLATELRIPESFSQSMKIAFNGDEKLIDVIQVNEKHYCFHLGDFGFNAKVIKKFEEEGSRGMLGYAKQFFSELIETEPFEFEFSVDGEKESHFRKAHLAVIANASRYGTGVVINPGSELNDGKFELCLIKPQPVSSLITVFANLFRNSEEESGYFERITCKELTIKMKTPELFQVDGELIGELEEVKTVVKRQALKIVC